MKTRKEILRVAESDGVYPMTTHTKAHERLGHMAHSTIEMLARNGAVLNFDVNLSTPIAQRHRALREKGEGECTIGDLNAKTNVTWLWLQKTKEAGESLWQLRKFATAMKAHSDSIEIQGSGAVMHHFIRSVAV